MAEQVRVAALAGFFPTLEAFGVDAAPLLKEVGLLPRLLGNSEQMIPARAVMRLLERAAQVTRCATFGLRMSENRGIANLGATSLLIAHQPTLRAALTTLNQYRNRINSMLVLNMDDFGDSIVIREDFLMEQPESSRQASELTLGVLARLCRNVVGETWKADTVCFTHAAPPATEAQVYHALFGCRPVFNAEFNGIVLDPRDLDRPNLRADAALAEHARALIESVLSPDGHSVAQQVEQSILLLMPTGQAGIQTCSDLLGKTVRTLQRDLDREGVSFTALLNKARMQLATQYLSNPRTRVTDVAQMLGYGSISAFTRWHIQSFGKPPSKHRIARPL